VDWVFAGTADEIPDGPADALFGYAPPGLLERVPVRWVQWWAAGVDRTGTVPPDVVLTRVVDLFSQGMAEYVLGCLLDWVKNFPTARRQQEERRWARYPSRTLAGQVVGVAGPGSIGGAVARVVTSLSGTVWTLATEPRPAPHVARAFGSGDVLEFMAGLDALVLVLPLTAKTRHFLNVDRLAALRPGACLVNVGRGGLVDEEALRAGLDRGQPAHAYLDVVEREPLPPDSWLWTHPAVTITPHVSGPNVLPDLVRYSLENLERFERGESLVGLVDRERGY
jgi:glyoxylate/hydroxypyruvate reductase A